MLRRCLSLRCAADRVILDSKAEFAFRALQKKAHVRCAMDLTQRSVMAHEEFRRMCVNAAPATRPEERMNEVEANQYLNSLIKAGVVLEHEGFVYLRPKQVLDDVLRECKLSPFNTEHPEEQLLRESNALRLEEQIAQARTAASANALWRRRFWAGVALASGAQMLGLSYLTFIMWGWDTMEPICYFITAGTAFASYLYFIAKSKNHSYGSVDADVLFNEEGSKASVSDVRLHAESVARLVQQASVDKAVEEAHNDLVEELIREAATPVAERT